MKPSIDDLFYGMVRLVKATAVVAATSSMVAVLLTGRAQLLLFTGFSVACAFYTDEILTKRDVEVVEAEHARHQIALAG